MKKPLVEENIAIRSSVNESDEIKLESLILSSSIGKDFDWINTDLII